MLGSSRADLFIFFRLQTRQKRTGSDRIPITKRHTPAPSGNRGEPFILALSWPVPVSLMVSWLAGCSAPVLHRLPAAAALNNHVIYLGLQNGGPSYYPSCGTLAKMRSIRWLFILIVIQDFFLHLKFKLENVLRFHELLLELLWKRVGYQIYLQKVQHAALWIRIRNKSFQIHNTGYNVPGTNIDQQIKSLKSTMQGLWSYRYFFYYRYQLTSVSYS